MPTASADTRRSWSLSCPRSSWQLPARPCRGCYRRRVACPSCSRRPLIQSAPASSRASLIRAVTSLGSPISDYSIGGKFLELLKDIAPRVTRAAVLRDPRDPAGVGQWAAIQTAAPSFGVELRPVDVRDAGEIERGLTAMARSSNGGLIVTGSAPAAVHRDLIITLAARQQLPAIYPFRYFVVQGGLISYGADPVDQFRRAAGYVDRILRGEKPADMPVQNPTKYELVVNLKTAKAMGLNVPETLLARADEVIE